MASSKFASWCDARRFGFGLRVYPESDASVLRVACLQKSLFAVDTPILAWAAGIGGQRRASALPDQPLPKGFVGSQRQAVRVVELGRQLWLRRIAFHATGCVWLWLFCIAALREPQQMVAGREGGQNRHRMDGSGGGRWMTCVCVGVGVGDGAMGSKEMHASHVHHMEQVCSALPALIGRGVHPLP